MKSPSCSSGRTSRVRRFVSQQASGAVLVIVLAFLVLLTGLIVAFFSRAMSERELSNSSVANTKVDLFALGASDVIIGDLRQEIAAGSNPKPVPSPAASGTIYLPKVPGNMLPALVATTGAAGTENLLKQSAYGQSFYPSTNYDANASNRASEVLTTSTSLNRRFCTMARWNAPLLLTKSNTNSDIDLTPVAAFRAPHWVFVTRSGSNPILSAAAAVPTELKVSGSDPVLGRYAYTIYHEGGLLDANVAGFPPDAFATASGTYFSSSKAGLAFADLSQLPGLDSSNPKQKEILHGLPAWRNWSSMQTDWSKNPAAKSAGGELAGSQGGIYKDTKWSGTLGSNYFNFVLSNTTGFLKTANQLVLDAGGNSYATDRPIASRQELIALLTKGFLSHGTSDEDKKARAKTQNALQYLTHFSRDLNQPSFIRVQSVDSTDPLGYDPTAPKVQPPTQGGNNAKDLDAVINPSFVAVRVGSTVANGRNDGSDLKAGEPLVKKRFALDRLAWLTCKGPSQSRASSGDADIVALKAAGISQAWLEQGTDKNILKYFGLEWDSREARWEYRHGRDSAQGPIRKLQYSGEQDVVSANREPNFFELLKASINVGSIGKTLTAPGVGDSAFQRQYNRDSSVDVQIVRMGANIIDQFDTDGYPTRIAFDDGSGLKEYAGVENLPYIYRTRNALIKIAEPKLTGSTSPYNTNYTPDGNSISISDTGVGAFMQYVDIWNPHDYSTTNLAQTMGAAWPGDQTGPPFRLVATTAAAIAVSAYPGSDPNASNASQLTTSGSDQTNSPGYNSMYGFPWAGEQRSLTEENTELTFEIPRTPAGAALFREPTILFQPGKPTGSKLTATAIKNQDSSLGVIANTSAFFANGGLKSDVGTTDGTGLPVKGQGYIGIYFGCHPLQWMRITTSGTKTDVKRILARQTGIQGSGADLTYKLQCKDPFDNWITYDQKSQTFVASLNDRLMERPEVNFLYPYIASGNFASVTDPRTSRFGLMYGYPSAFAFFVPPFHGNYNNVDQTLRAPPVFPYRSGWLNKSEGTVLTDRNGYMGGVPVPNAGQAVGQPFQSWSPTPQMGWYPGGWATNGPEPMLRLGLLTQNDPLYTTGRSLCDQTGYDTDQTPPRGLGALPGGRVYTTFYSDPDGVVRRAMGAYNTANTYVGTASNQASSAPGLPMATANDNGNARILQSNSRPMVLNRPFRTVSELAYVFSDTPWKNLNFFTPESGDTALLDVFCVQDSDNGNALVAGKVNLNTRQLPVLRAVVAGAYKDEWNEGNPIVSGSVAALTSSEPSKIAAKLLARTTGKTINGQAPAITGTALCFTNLSELVGKWKPGSTKSVPTDNVIPEVNNTAYGPTICYDGFSSAIGNILASGTDRLLGRYREATMRALTGSGQTRVWNLMIDVVAQTGRYPQTANSSEKFLVEGERRYWVHVAIDRLTGDVIDKQVEVVKE